MRNGDLTLGLPAHAYTSDEIFKLETEHIFRKQWHIVCREKDIPEPGEYRTALVAGEPILVIRRDDKAIAGYYNVCQHRGHLLLANAGRVNNIVCPYHAWTYGKDGDLKHACGLEKSRATDLSSYALQPVAIGVRAGFVMVNLSHDPVPLEDYTREWEAGLRELLPHIDDLVTVSTTSTEVRCNWKIFIENSMECGHCHVAHPTFRRQVSTEQYRVQNTDWRYGAFHRSVVKENELGIPPGTTFAYAFLWPHFDFRIFVGPYNLLMRRQVPVSPTRTKVYETYFHLSASEPDLKNYDVGLHNETFAEDVAIIESVQRGLESSGYRRRMSYMTPSEVCTYSEDMCAVFNRRIAEAIGL